MVFILAIFVVVVRCFLKSSFVAGYYHHVVWYSAFSAAELVDVYKYVISCYVEVC